MSTSEEVSAAAKPRPSPLEFRNTELVSRLLAATPPYLYNMPLVPHSYFFSEMLRSLVQGKAEAAARAAPVAPPRRARKRSWSQPRHPSPAADMPPPTWTPSKPEPLMERPLERPLELTRHKMCPQEVEPLGPPPPPPPPADKPELPPTHMPLMFPQLSAQEAPNAGPTAHSDLILPPPPPIWYPPLYPGPYGIDPLHFFIDLRVSGHIYDRKGPKEPTGLGLTNHVPHEMNSTSGISLPPSTVDTIGNYSLMKQPRHPSAFSVPNPSLARNDPLNLSGHKYHSEEKPGKFDIKSMGFDTNTENGKSPNYVLKNLSRIYKDVQGGQRQEDGIDLSAGKCENAEMMQPPEEQVNVKDEDGENKVADKENDKEKRCKDLRALIGLELVVDYVKHEVKPGTKCHPEATVPDIVSSAGSPAVQIIDGLNVV